MTVAVVTGSAGQDGRLLTRSLRADGWQVVGVVRPGAGAADGEQEVDLTDDNAVAELVDQTRPRVFFHLAAVHRPAATTAAGPATRAAMVAVNFTATRLIAEALAVASAPCRLVFAGSSQMYRPADPPAVVDEDTCPEPSSYYGLTKAWSFELLRFLRAREGLDACTAILFNHESPHRPEGFVVRKITAAAARIAAGSSERLSLGNIGAQRDWSSADDVVEALRLIAMAPTPRDYVVASGELRRVSDVLDVAFEAVGLDWREHTDASANEPEPAVVGRVARIRQDLGWQPTVDFETIVGGMLAADVGAQERRHAWG